MPHSPPRFPFGRCPCKAASLSPLALAPGAVGTGLACPSSHCPFLRASLCPFPRQPSEEESDRDEYQSQGDSGPDLEEQGGVTVLEPSAVPVSVPALVLGTASILGWKELPSPWLQEEGVWDCFNQNSMNPSWILFCSDRVPVPTQPPGLRAAPRAGSRGSSCGQQWGRCSRCGQW